jgi:hypothetical protein
VCLPHTHTRTHHADFDEAHAEARKKLAASGERLATEMLDKESAKLRAIMGGSDASVEAVEAELRRWPGVRVCEQRRRRACAC